VDHRLFVSVQTATARASMIRWSNVTAAPSVTTSSMPELQLLSNGSYHVMATASGRAYSRWKDMAVTRFSEDPINGSGGMLCYLHDDAARCTWSTTIQPGLQQSGACEHDFRESGTSFRRLDHGIDSRSEIAVSLHDAVELRRVVFTNLCNSRRALSATSYSEIVLCASRTDSAHPAFSKLFIETDIDPVLQAILATRRPSTPADPTPWLFHTALISSTTVGALTFETDRMRFIGRGRDADNPKAMDNSDSLSGKTGAVLDAVAAIRVPFVLEAGESITIDWLTGVANTRDACIALARKVSDARGAQHILKQAGSYRRSVLRTLAISDADALIHQRMAASLIFATAALRADAGVIEQNRRGQSGLWQFGISGDLPIVLLRLAGPVRSAVTSQMVQAQAYWNAFGVRSELAVLCAPSPDDPTCFDETRRLIESGPGAGRLGKPGGIFVLDDVKLDAGDRILLQSVARIVVSDEFELAEQLTHRLDDSRSESTPAIAEAATPDDLNREPPSDTGAANGFGNFTPDGREYVFETSAARMTPAPWVNVIANPDFGTLVSESGSATTWSENAHEFRLTPWSNDPVSDPNTEAFYIRDETTGRFWSPTVLPTRAAGPYTTRHGFGYSVFEHAEDGIASELRMYVAIDSPVKFSVLNLRNRSERPRALSVTGHVDWVLGDERSKTRMQVVTQVDTQTGAFFARNDYNTDFAGRTAFFDVDDGASDVCGDRADFFGPTGTLAAPAALMRSQLSGRVGAALDPCAALRVGVNLEPGQTQVVVFRLGAGKSADEARELVRRWRRPAAAHKALEAVHAFWRRTLGAVQVRTPNPALDVLANGWLLYQVIASRLWGRTAFYQSSGAFGFRDQLQDVMALVHAAPDLVREHLLRAASRQFVEGDVQHWWHPPSGKGVRTRCADDLLWLPLATCRYVEVTGDRGILDAERPFLESRPLKDGEASNYELPAPSGQAANLYVHCARAIRRGLTCGAHGLPLMGSGDWNDGMNLVGAGGQGESVWMAFFLVTVLRRFAPVARAHADPAFADYCEHEAEQLRGRIEESAWDGAWYRRAWFDDGTVLGSVVNAECQIDSIAQSWAVLSCAAPADRARQAMDSLGERLVNRDKRIVRLLAPPFDTSKPSPGYIQGYVPGVRENGGQYTHAAMWAAMAFAALGDAERAWELFALLNPISHAGDAGQVNTYKVEPYVVAGDVYANAAHAGRGGWTWYTGSAGWMVQLIVESLLGLRRQGTRLCIRPLMPMSWVSFEMQYHFGASRYDITCRRAEELTAASVIHDGVETEGEAIMLRDDGQVHTIVVNFPYPRESNSTQRRNTCSSE
jgi:cyclic beta-1,2-glucan synthetase